MIEKLDTTLLNIAEPNISSGGEFFISVVCVLALASMVGFAYCIISDCKDKQ